MTDDTSFSLRNNAKRAAQRMIETGKAPSIDYAISARDDGRFKIVWRTGENPSAAEIEQQEPAAAANEPVAKKPKSRTRAGVVAGLYRGAPKLPPGTMLEKPVITSKANPHYQKRFDRLAELAAAGDWDGVAAYEVTGSNTYSKKLRRYRDQLLAYAASLTDAATA